MPLRLLKRRKAICHRQSGSGVNPGESGDIHHGTVITNIRCLLAELQISAGVKIGLALNRGRPVISVGLASNSIAADRQRHKRLLRGRCDQSCRSRYCPTFERQTGSRRLPAVLRH